METECIELTRFPDSQHNRESYLLYTTHLPSECCVTLKPPEQAPALAWGTVQYINNRIKDKLPTATKATATKATVTAEQISPQTNALQSYIIIMRNETNMCINWCSPSSLHHPPHLLVHRKRCRNKGAGVRGVHLMIGMIMAVSCHSPHLSINHKLSVDSSKIFCYTCYIF